MDPFELEAMYLLREINTNLSRMFTRYFESHGISWSQAGVLLALMERDGRTIGELCTALGCQKSNLSPLCKRLEAAGYVTRQRGEDDQRLVRIFLTDNSRQLLEECMDRRDSFQQGLDPKKQTAILESLRELHQISCACQASPCTPHTPNENHSNGSIGRI